MRQRLLKRIGPTYMFLVPVALLGVLAVRVAAQPDDPFPDPFSPPDTAPTAEETVVDRPPLVQTALNSIRAQNPQSAAELLRAVDILQRLGANEDAKVYFERASALDPAADELIALHDELGTARLIQIANDKQLGPNAHPFIRSIFEAVRQSRQDPERLKTWITNLAAAQPEEQRAAIIGLAQAGSRAIPALLDGYRHPPEGVTPALLDAAATRIGAKAEQPLLAALGCPDRMVQIVAVRLLATTGSKKSRNSLIRPYFSEDESLKAATATTLRSLRLGRPGSRADSAHYLSAQARQQLQDKSPLVPGDPLTLEMWTWSAEEDNVVPHELTSREAASIAAARLAKDAYELEATEENTLLLLVAQLQVDQFLGGLDQPLRQGPGTAHALGLATGPDTVSEALAYSLEHQLDDAALGATRILATTGSSKDVVRGNPWSPLVRALQSPNRRVRHGAAQAIMSVDPRQRYAGDSLLIEALIDLSRASGSPRALVGTPRQASAQHLSGVLNGMGLQVTRIDSTRGTLREAMSTSDYDVLFVSDSVSRPTAYEFIQQLRKDPQSRYLPVVLMVREGQLDRAEQIASQDERVFVLPELVEENMIAPVLASAEASVAGVAVPPRRRTAQAKDALRWLGHLAEYSRTYPWYDVMRSRSAAAEVASVPELSAASIDLLGYLGDERSQEILVDTASLPGISEENQQRAANAFAESVLRRGLMLREPFVRQQYARYNASSTASVAAQEVLGQILDVIETQTKATSTKSR